MDKVFKVKVVKVVKQKRFAEPEDGLRRCRICRHAELLQWGNNPIIAKCNITADRYVANVPKRCEMFECRMPEEVAREKILQMRPKDATGTAH